LADTIHRNALFVLVGVAALIASTPALSQNQGSTTFGASRAEIISPISVTALDDLTFGGIAVTSNQGGSVKVLPGAGPAEYSGAAAPACTGTGGCTTNPALFHVRGERNRSYVIAVPAVIYAQATNGTNRELPVSDLTSKSLNLPGASFRGFLNGAGQDEVQVGGTLAIPAGTPPGSYRAEISLVVSYD